MTEAIVLCDVANGVVDSTFLGDFLQCKRKAAWRWVRGLEYQAEFRYALEFGKLIHEMRGAFVSKGYKAAVAVIEAAKPRWPLVSPPDQLRTPEYALLVLDEYLNNHDDPSFVLRPESMEMAFSVEMPLGARLAGRIDSLVEWHDLLWVLECKTSKWLGQKDSSSFFSKFEREIQTHAYPFAMQRLGYDVAGVVMEGIGLWTKGPGVRRDLQIRSPEALEAFESDFKQWMELVTTWGMDYTKWPREWTCRNTLRGKCPYQSLCFGDFDANVDSFTAVPLVRMSTDNDEEGEVDG